MCYVEKLPVVHRYQLELIIPKDDSLIWNDTEKAIDHILSKSSAVITDLTYDDDEDEVTVILSYETESKLSYSDSYWDEDGGEEGFDEIEDGVSPQDIEEAIRSYGKIHMNVLDDEIEYD